MQLFNVVTKKEFVTKEGEHKVLWHKVGIIKLTEQGKMYLQLFTFPNVNFYVMEPKNENIQSSYFDKLGDFGGEGKI